MLSYEKGLMGYCNYTSGSCNYHVPVKNWKAYS